MRIFVVSAKKLLLGSSICAAALLLAGTGLLFGLRTSPASTKTVTQSNKLPVYCVQTNEKKIALTFDAAWGNSDTDQLISILKKHNAKATFFTTGDWVDKFPNDVKKLYAAGHDIQNHSDKHPHPVKISEKELIADTKACDDKIEKLIGKRPRFYRPPYGEYDEAVIASFEKAGTHQVIQWNIDSRDWKRPTVEQMVSSVVKSTAPGSILLFHNDIPNTPPALDAILTQLDKDDYHYVLVSDLVLTDNYTIDANGMQIAK